MCLLTEDSLRVWDVPIVKEKVGKRTVRRLDYEAFADRVDMLWCNTTHAAVYIEKVASMSKQGVASMFAFGDIYGSMKMAFVYAGFSINLVPPATWKLAMGCGANKESSLVQCLQLWGDKHRHLWFGERQGTLDGRCEAALLAEYARRQCDGRV